MFETLSEIIFGLLPRPLRWGCLGLIGVSIASLFIWSYLGEG